MKYENKYYCINYDECNNGFIDDLVDALNSNLNRIMSFFKINEFSQQKSIKIWNSLDDYKAYLQPYREYRDWLVAHTFDGNINILSYDLYLSGVYKNSNMSNYRKIIIHELVHSCQQEINPDARNVIWFWEALATNLAGQECKITAIPYSKDDLMFNYRSLNDPYCVSYVIGKYMLEAYKNYQILEYVKFPDKLIGDMDNILVKTKDWVNIVK